jgi:hypothetical protein
MRTGRLGEYVDVMGCSDGRRGKSYLMWSLYFSPDIVRMIKFRKIGRAGHIACMEMLNAYRVLV